MLLILIELYIFRQIIEIAIDDHADVTALSGSFEKFFLGAFTASDYWGEHLKLRLLREFLDLITHLVYRLLVDRSAAVRTVRYSATRIQESQVVIDLCDCSDC